MNHHENAPSRPHKTAPVPRPVIVVTGTDTGVGKTIVTAALACALAKAGTVAVYKPVQTGVLPGGFGDADEVQRLSGVREASAGMTLPEPMAPVAAAEHAGVELPTISEHAARVVVMRERAEWVLVEGTGGVLVELDAAGATIADLGRNLGDTHGVAVVTVVVVRAGLGTLNHTALTIEALDRRGLPVAAVVIGSWPDRPGTVELANREHVARTHALDAVPCAASQLEPAVFQSESARWLARALVGVGARP